MNERSNIQPGFLWLLFAVGGCITIVNMVLSFTFGANYLVGAFDGVGQGGDILAGLYTLLIFDFAFLAWLFANMRLAENMGQRHLSIIMAAVSLFGSTTATLAQLSISGELIQLTEAGSKSLGLWALGIMLIVTTGQILAFTWYFKLSPKEKLIDKQAQIQANIHDQVLIDLETEMQKDIPWLVEQAKINERNKLLTSMGYDRDANMVADGNGFHGGDNKRVEGKNPINTPTPTSNNAEDVYCFLQVPNGGNWETVAQGWDLAKLQRKAEMYYQTYRIIDNDSRIIERSEEAAPTRINGTRFFSEEDGEVLMKRNRRPAAHQNGDGSNFQ